MSKFFINRPIVAMVISILMVIIGTVALLGLPTAQFPDIIPPEIQVTAMYPGADANTLEQSVTTPLEQQISGVDNMEYMSSTSANNGSATITVTFNINTDPNVDQVLTQLRTAQAASQLPAEVNTSGLTVQKSLNSPLMFISLYSPDSSRDDVFLSNYAYINLVDELTRVKGVARVQTFGGGQYAMRIWIKPDQLAKLNVTVPDLISAVQAQNRVNPAGKLGGRPVPKGQEFTLTVRAQGRFSTPEEFGGIIIRSNPDGSTLRLKDVARIEMGAQTYDMISRFNGQATSGMAIYQLPGSNAVATAQLVTAKLDELKKRFPKGLALDMTLDTTKVVTQGMKEITYTLLEALALVVLVVYIFLQGWRATLIPLLAVPVSLIGTFMIFPMLGFSVNTLSLFGLVLAIGLVVDDAIVVVEAVEHHIEKGLSPRDASLKAMEEVSGPVIAIALILAAVFIPTAFIPGITGRLYQQFAVTIAISVVISAFNALSLSPALCALLLKPKKPSNGPLARFFGAFNRGFQKVTDRYIGISGAMIRKSALSLLFLVLVTGAGVALGYRLPSSFLPTEDQGYLLVAMRLPDASSLERSDAAARKIEERVKKIPGVASVFTVVGFDLLTGVQNTYNGIFWVTLKDWSERKNAEEQFEVIQGRIAGEISQVPDAFAFPISPPAIPGVGSTGGFTFVLEDRSGGSEDEFAKNVFKFVGAASKKPELAGVNSAFLPNVPQLFVDVDREKAAKQGVAIGDIYNTLQTFMGGYLVNYFNRFGRQWQVYVAAEGEYRTKPEDIGQFYVKNSAGTMVPLSALTSTSKRSGSEFNFRYNEYRATQIFGAAAPGYSSGQAMAALEAAFAESMPPTMAFDYTGMSFQEKKASEGISPAAIYGISLLFVFLILAAQYESWSLPLSVLLVTPVAVLGAYLALLLRGFENNVYAQIGLVMLIGMSAKNAILIIEFAKLEYERGTSIVDSALIAARLRLRPILMTAFAFILGCVPLWTATGSGAVSRQILGTVVIGGMLAATLIAIFLIPVMFVVVERMIVRFSPKTVLPLLICVCVLSISGCTMGPKYSRPTVAAPPTFRAAPDAAPAESLGDAKWWTVFQDEELQKLIRTALEGNFDVKMAAARVAQAQAQLGVTRADQLPTISGTGSAARQRNPSNPVFPAFEANMSQLGLSAAWQLDFWGRYRKAAEADRALLAASEWGRKAVVGTLVSNLATAYFQLREYDLELEISKRTLAARKESLGLTRTLEEGGAVSRVDVHQAEILVEQAGRKVPELERRIEQQENLISILVGRNPDGVGRGQKLVDQALPPVIPTGLPSALLERRPDIRRAELELVAANARIGVAKAAYFPQISLTGAAGFQAYSMTGLFDSKVYNIGAAMTQPIFDYGRIRNTARLTEARKEEMLASYLKSIQQAFREVSDSLIAVTKNREYRERQQALRQAAQQAADLSGIRYRGGATSYLEVLRSETDLFDSEIDLAQAQLNERLAVVQVYNALGGGWQN